MSERLTLFFGITGSLWYLLWAASAWGTSDRHMTGALLCYAAANVFLLWPIIRRFV